MNDREIKTVSSQTSSSSFSAPVVARLAKPGRDGTSLAGLVNNPLTGARPPSHDLYENQSETPRGSTRAVAGQRTCLLRSSPGSKGMGLSLNNQEPNGTPHRVTTVNDDSPAARAGQRFRSNFVFTLLILLLCFSVQQV